MDALNSDNLDVRLKYSRLSALWDEAHQELDRLVRVAGVAKADTARAIQAVEEQEKNVSALAWALDQLKRSL